MNAWYQVLSMGFGYVSSVMILAVTVLALRLFWQDQGRYRRVRRAYPQTGRAGSLEIVQGRGRLKSGTQIPLSYEGTLGSAPGCDLCLPVRGLPFRAAFFWVDKELHVVPIRKADLQADGEPLRPGDEAVLRDGAKLEAGGIVLKVHLSGNVSVHAPKDPYVTKARRNVARGGRGNAIGDGGVAAKRVRGGTQRKKTPEAAETEPEKNNKRLSRREKAAGTSMKRAGR